MLGANFTRSLYELRFDVIERFIFRAKCVSSTMRLIAVVCHLSTLCKQTHPNSCLLTHIKYWGDQVSQFTMAHCGGIIAILSRAVVLLHSDSLYGPRLSNCWLPAATWAELLVKSGHIDPTLVTVNARKFNTAMSKSILFGKMTLWRHKSIRYVPSVLSGTILLIVCWEEKASQLSVSVGLSMKGESWASSSECPGVYSFDTRSTTSFFRKPRCRGKW